MKIPALLPLALTCALTAGQLSHSPIASVASDDFSDLAFLKPLVAGRRIVQLGESGHGMGDVQRLKARLVGYLHEQLGFNVMAFESSLYHCHVADGRAAAAEPQTTLMNCALGVWHTREVLPVFEAVRASRSGGHPLRLAGFDVQPIGLLRKTRAAFFERVLSTIDPAFGATIAALDSEFMAAYDKDAATRRAYLSGNRGRLLETYARVEDFITRNLSRMEEALGREAPLVARQECRSMAAYVGQQTSADPAVSAEARDRGMADNVRFIAAELFPNEKIIVWADNYHVRYANERIVPRPEVFPGVAARSMGGWIREAFGRAVYTIGTYPYEGTAVDNARRPYTVSRPDPGSLEQRLLTTSPATFVDLATQGTPWADTLQRVRFNGTQVQSLIPREQYDAIILLTRVSPPVFLY